MLINISTWLQKTSKNGWLVLASFVLNMLFMGLVMPYAGAILALAVGNGTGPLDLRFFYTPQEALAAVEAYGESGRAIYRIIELSADVIYPLVYTLAYGLLISWFFQRGFAAGSPWQRANLLPVFALFFDLLENAAIVILLSVFPSAPFFLAALAALFTLLKWVFAFGSIFCLLIGLLAWLVSKFKK